MKESNIMDKFSRPSLVSGRSGGFSLMELLIAMALGLVVLGAMYSVFTLQNKTLTNQEDSVVMQQSVRAGMDMMTREIVMAGYNPAKGAFNGVTLNQDQLEIKVDLSNPSDGDTDEENEKIVYKYYNTLDYPYQIKRKTGNGEFQPFVENVESFAFEYLKSSNPDVVATNSADIRQIRITITGRTARPDPNYPVNDGYRTYTLTSIITPRNLAY